MSATIELLDALAQLLTYPGDLTWEDQLAAIARIRAACPEASDQLLEFERTLGAMSAGEREELFTRTFDNTDERSLEIGWQLFGENYARGALMVRLRGLLRQHGVVESSELPDHLTHVLRLVGRAPEILSRALIQGQVLQALAKLEVGCRSFDSPWCIVLETTRVVLERQLEPSSVAVSQ